MGRAMTGRYALRRLVWLPLALVLSTLGPSAQGREPPRTEEELVSVVRTALTSRDLAAFEELINWEGASVMRRRMTTFQLRSGFGRPIRSIGLEPFPADGLRELESGGTLKANMPITQRLRVVFDEPPGESGRPPTSLFLVGKEDDAYRIGLVVAAKPRPKDAD